MIERWRKADPSVVDGLLALFCATVTIATVVVADEPHDGSDINPLVIALLLGQTLPVAWRRRRPVLAWAVCGAAAAIYGVGEFPDTVLDLGPLIVVFSVAAHCRRRTATVLGVATALTLALSLLVAGDASTEDVAFNVLVFGVAWVLGENQRTRRAYTAELEDKAARLERSRAEEAARAVAEERARIAHELHDVVAHHVSMMVVQAEGGASVLEKSPEQASRAFDPISAAGRQAMAEMRRVVGVLRDDADGGAERAPQPGLHAVAELVDGVRRAGLPVELRVEGRPRRLPTASTSRPTASCRRRSPTPSATPGPAGRRSPSAMPTSTSSWRSPTTGWARLPPWPRRGWPTATASSACARGSPCSAAASRSASATAEGSR